MYYKNILQTPAHLQFVYKYNREYNSSDRSLSNLKHYYIQHDIFNAILCTGVYIRYLYVLQNFIPIYICYKVQYNLFSLFAVSNSQVMVYIYIYI